MGSSLEPGSLPSEFDEYPANLYADILIRIRQQSVRPVESGSDAVFTPTYDALFECRRDCEEIRNRARDEGMSFLTHTLPQYGKALDRALLGHKDSFAVIPFRKENGTAYPELFREIVSRVLDANGEVRSDACPQSVRLLRQLTFSFYKLNVPYVESLNDKVIQNFVQIDQDLPRSFGGFPRALGSLYTTFTERLADLPHGNDVSLPGELGLCIQVARYVIGSILGNCCPFSIKPKHGPGAVATGEKGAEKNHFSHIPERLERMYPYTEYMRFNLSHVSDTCDVPPDISGVGTAKVVLVPKDSRGPRLISCEGLSNQYIQQGQMATLVEAICSHRLSKSQVNFSDQSINGALALASSLSQEYATLDMKDASDRVSWALIELLFPIHWIEALWSSRSPATKLPNGQTVRLKKFAPMGSAVCFPVEALVFFALSVGAVYSKRMRASNGVSSLCLYGEGTHYLDRKCIRKIARTIYVYGDDIIARTEDSGSIIAYLESFSLRFNQEKCCSTGFFRESCGVDAFKGVNVTPVRFRTLLSQSSLTPEALISWVAYSNALYEKGYVKTAEAISGYLLHKKRIPTVMVPADKLHLRFGGVCFVRPYPGSPSCNKRRYNPILQRHEALMDVVVPAKTRSATLDWPELLRKFSDSPPKEFDIYTSDPGSAGVYAVPRRYKLVRGWVPLY